MTTKPEPVTVGQIAKRLGYSVSTVHLWKHRPDFPKPLADLPIGKVWDMREVEAWESATAEERRERGNR